MIRATVIEAHAPVHEDVLMGKAGDVVRLGRKDDEWPGWVWCTSEKGVGSWVPELYLARDGENGRLLVDYEATELTVSPGDRLALHHEVNGWWWATAVNGAQGWVPADKVTSLQ
jgi:hypothetical protein